MSTAPEKEEAPDRWSFTFVFTEPAQAAKLAAYWAKPAKDELKLGSRGWPAPEAWKVLALTVRDMLVHMVGECAGGAQRGLVELMSYADRSGEVRAVVEAFGKTGRK